ncbi:MAG: hypothetical protein KDB03_17500 [Planctomycetales bacterium]|nr:hypothetical protein [Planctomycetales bacterium]
MSQAEEPETVIDVSGLDSNKLLRRLRDQESAKSDAISRIRLTNSGPSVELIHGVGAFLRSNLLLECEFDLGDFVFFAGTMADVRVAGDVGKSCAHSIASGSLLVRGNAGAYLAAFATGGYVAVLGKAGDRCGLGNSGAEMVVRGDVGDDAACGMSDGVLVLGRGAGKNLGLGMTGGLILIRGQAESIAPDVKKVRLKDADNLKTSLLLARAGIKATGVEFTGYRPVGGVK